MNARARRAAKRPAAPPWRDDAPVRIGVSSCLLGEEVRWDGGHKRDRFLTDVLAPYVVWVPVCPEVEIGMGVPRETVQLVREGGDTRLRGTRSGRDWTREMGRFAARRTRQLEALDLSGYVLKRDSPSCGMERVRLWREGAPPRRVARGLFAAALLERFLSLPVEDEGRLADPVARESWIERVFAYRLLRSFFAGRWTLAGLVAFHDAHELQLLAHSAGAPRRLGRLVARAKGMPRAELRERYERGFMSALAEPATRRRHASVLQRCLAMLGDRVAPAVREELAARVADYRGGVVPLVVPVTLLRHYATQLGVERLAQQVYLDPHPKELMLRNHV